MLWMLIVGLLIFSPLLYVGAGYYLVTPTAAEAVTDSGVFAWDNLVIQSVLAGNSSTGGGAGVAQCDNRSYGHYAIDYITVPTIINSDSRVLY